jgi:hypothetical protein
MFAVCGSNIHWQWCDNPYVVGWLGYWLAFVASVLLAKLLDWRNSWPSR